MIVTIGKLRLLLIQQPQLQTYQWGLFTNNVPDAPGNTFASLVEATFVGYTRITVGVLSAPSIVSGRAQTVPTVQPIWTNGDILPKTIWGWFLIDPSDGTLISSTNIGLVTIPIGLSFSLSPAITDTEE